MPSNKLQKCIAFTGLLVVGVTGCIDSLDDSGGMANRVSVVGHVNDPSGRGVAGVVVAATGVTDASVTNAQGRFELKVPPSWTGAIRPEKLDLAFTPAERRLSNVSGDVSDNDFVATWSGHCGVTTDTGPTITIPGSQPDMTTPPNTDDTTDSADAVVQADAGNGQYLQLAGSAAANVQLDGSGSIAPDGATFEWRDESGAVIGSGARASVQLGEGMHTLKLVVRTNDGIQSEDEVIIQVSAGGPATLIVDRNNPNASGAGPGTPEQPFSSIELAVRSAQPGDTVLIKTGVYKREHPSVNRRVVQLKDVHGTADLPITIKAADGADVLITGTYDGGSIGSAGVEILDCSYLVISGLRFDTFTGVGLDVNASAPGATHHITVEYCIATNCSLGTNTFVSAYRAIGPAHYITFRKCMASASNTGIILGEAPVQTRQTAAVPPRAGNNAPGTPDCGFDADMPEDTWNLWPGWIQVAPRWCLIEDCLLYDNAHVPEHSDGIGTRYTVDCIVRNNVAFRNADDNYDMLGATRMTFTGNIAFDADPNDLPDGDGNGIKVGVRGGLDCVVANNITFDNDRMGIDMGDTERGIVLHNTIVNNGDGHANGFGLWFEGGRSASGHNVLFNIIQGNGRNTSRGDYGADKHVSMDLSDSNSISDGHNHNFAAPRGSNDRINNVVDFPNGGMTIDTNFTADMSIDDRLESIRSQVRRKFALPAGSPLRGASYGVPGVTDGVSGAGQNWGAVQD